MLDPNAIAGGWPITVEAAMANSHLDSCLGMRSGRAKIADSPMN